MRKYVYICILASFFGLSLAQDEVFVQLEQDSLPQAPIIVTVQQAPIQQEDQVVLDEKALRKQQKLERKKEKERRKAEKLSQIMLIKQQKREYKLKKAKDPNHSGPYLEGNIGFVTSKFNTVAEKKSTDVKREFRHSKGFEGGAKAGFNLMGHFLFLLDYNMGLYNGDIKETTRTYTHDFNNNKHSKKYHEEETQYEDDILHQYLGVNFTYIPITDTNNVFSNAFISGAIGISGVNGKIDIPNAIELHLELGKLWRISTRLLLGVSAIYSTEISGEEEDFYYKGKTKYSGQSIGILIKLARK